MVVIKNNVMYSCRVFHIGSCGIEEGKKGVEALQAPLRELYKGDPNLCGGVDMNITVMPELIHFQPTDGSDRGIELNISTLSICAAVRCVDSQADPGNMKFVPVHSVITAHEPDSDHPALFSTVMRRQAGGDLELFAFICNETRDALHLVNATQTAHSTMQRGYSPSGAMKFFIDQSTEFDRTIRLQSTSGGSRTDTKKIYTYHEDYDTRDVGRASVRQLMSTDRESRNVSRVSRYYNDDNVVMNGNEDTIYIKAGEVNFPETAQATKGETIVIGYNKDDAPRAPTPPPQQTIVIDQPVIRPPQPVEIPRPEIIERKVYIDPPKPPKLAPQRIKVDVPVFKGFPEWEPQPPPEIIENKVYLEPPPPPKPKAQRIVVDKVILKDYPEQPDPPAPIIEEREVVIEPPPYKLQKAQRIIVDRPYIADIKPPPPPPPPIIEERPIRIEMPDYPPQKPHTVVVEQPIFNEPKPAPRPPTPIIERKKVYIDPPAYPTQQRQRVVVETPVIRSPGPPPKPLDPIVVEKPVYVDGPKWPEPVAQRIVVEKVCIRDPGPPPPQPPPIIVEKIVWVDPPPWPKPQQQKIVVEVPKFRQYAPPPAPEPMIIQKPVMIDAPAPPPPQRQKVVVERPVYRTTYQTRTVPTGYAYERTVPGPTYRSSYAVHRSGGSPKGLRRYAWSENGEENSRRVTEQQQSAYRLYGQPRDFRRTENQFINERGFARRLNNEDVRFTRGPGSYTYGAQRRGSLSS